MIPPVHPPHGPAARAWPSVVAAALVTAGLAMLAYRGQRIIGFDSHYYLEYTKQFHTSLPDHFGTHWPFGFPLLGAALASAVGSSFHGLLGVCWLAWLALCALIHAPLARALGPRPAGVALLAIAAAAIVVIEVGTLRSELAYAALQTAALAALARSEAPRAAWFAAAAVVLGVTIRYAGVLGLPLLGAWLLWTGRDLPWRAAARRLVPVLVAAGCCGALLLWNQRVTGYLSGASRPPGAGWTGLPGTVADLGWGALVSLSSIGVRARWLDHPLQLLLIGWLAAAAIFALAAWAWLRPVTQWSRPFALGLAGYAAGMVALAALRDFDALYNGRSFLPALPLALVLGLERFHARPWRGVALALVCVTAPGLAVAARGISPAIAPDFAPVVARLQHTLASGESVGVNLHAVGLSAWLEQRVIRVDDGESQLVDHRFLVYRRGAGEPAGQSWMHGEPPPGFALEFTDHQLSLWRRAEPRPAPLP